MIEGRFHYDWKTGRMKDTQSKSQATKDMRILETIINDACYSYEKKIKELKKRIKQQEELISEQAIQLDYLQAENKHMKDVLHENKQLKEQIRELNRINNICEEQIFCGSCEHLYIYDDGCVNGVQYEDWYCQKHDKWINEDTIACEDYK